MTIKEILESQFIKQVGYFPNIDSPKSFNEKIQWLKLYYKDSLLTVCADKYKSREYVSKTIGEKYLIPLLGTYKNINQINFDLLPNKFVLKQNNGSGHNIICIDKSKLDINDVKTQLSSWLEPQSNLYYFSYEWAYKNIKPIIVCEKFLDSKNGLKEYKFYCFNGIVKFLHVGVDREENDLKINFYDINWQPLPFQSRRPTTSKKLNRPKKYNEMLEIAKKLSAKFPFVRVDLYCVKNQIYFSELTFYPSAGFTLFRPVEWDIKIGEYLDISHLKKTANIEIFENIKSRLKKLLKK